MHLTSLMLDAPGRPLSTYLLADEGEVLARLREQFPSVSTSVPDEELVHVLNTQGVRTKIVRHDISDLIAAQIPAGEGSSTYGDLFRYDTYLSPNSARQGQFLRPATALEAAYSRSCARLDGGLGVFGVHPVLADGRAARATGPDGWQNAHRGFLHHGTPAWDRALLSSSVRYYRVDAIPAEANLPDLTSISEISTSMGETSSS
ncbi:hypothetical protein [Kineosporia babensis]|uniref:Uncharacterized protein n=1 Tax=Kineosporia babensis TaxID=499548 RepID=A0A9X1NPM9_9ACTN|nr:hypothetical protein [Kineosporia babensis]MCD5316893.1 hypothetical protein [Kineosporia babensis]